MRTPTQNVSRIHFFKFCRKKHHSSVGTKHGHTYGNLHDMDLNTGNEALNNVYHVAIILSNCYVEPTIDEFPIDMYAIGRVCCFQSYC